jgi:lipoprotein signal peptidase
VIYLAVSAALVFVADRWTKAAARRVGRQPWGSLAQCRYVLNRKTLYRRTSIRIALCFIWGLSCASAMLLHGFGLWFQTPFQLLALGCALGGAAGNLLDIVQHYYVVDFVDLGWWPVFNLADVGIVGGLAFALWPH